MATGWELKGRVVAGQEHFQHVVECPEDGKAPEQHQGLEKGAAGAQAKHLRVGSAVGQPQFLGGMKTLPKVATPRGLPPPPSTKGVTLRVLAVMV